MVYDLYTDEEWAEIREKINYKGRMHFRLMYGIPAEHKKLFYAYVIGGSEDSDMFKDLCEALYGRLSLVPLYINTQPGIVEWRLSHGK